MHHSIQNDIRRTRHWVWLMFCVAFICSSTQVSAYECDANARRLQTGKCQCSDNLCDASPRAHQRPGVKCAPCQVFPLPDDEDEYPRVCGFAVQFRGRSGLSRSSLDDFMIMQDAVSPSEIMDPGEPMASASACRDDCVAKLGKSCTFFHWRGADSTAPCLLGGTCFIPKIDSVFSDPFATAATNSTSSSILFVRRRQLELPDFDLLRTDAHTSTHKCAFNDSPQVFKNDHSAKARSLRECASACVELGPKCTSIAWIGSRSADNEPAHGFECVLNPGKLACEFNASMSQSEEMEPVTTIVTGAREYSIPGYWAPQQVLVCTGGNTLPGNDSEAHVRVEDIDRCANLCNSAGSKCEAFVWTSEQSDSLHGEMLSSPGGCLMKKSRDCKQQHLTVLSPSVLLYAKAD